MKLDALNDVLHEMAEEVNLAAKRELGSRKIGKNRNYGVASGSLQRSLSFTVDGERVLFGSPLPYAKFVHWGVNGTKKKRGAPYSYTNKMPPIDAILKWMKVKPVRLRDSNGKFIKQTDQALRSAAFMIARSIKRNGIAGLFYYEGAMEKQAPRFRKKFGDAVVNDVFASFNFKVGNITIKPK